MIEPVLLGALAVVGFTVIGNEGEPTRWPTSRVDVVIQEDGSDDITDGSDLAAIRASLATWNHVTCAAIELLDGGTSPLRAYDDRDGVNRITFIEENWPPWAMGAGAYTFRVNDTTTQPWTWQEFDIAVNGQDYEWSTQGQLDRVDVQSIVTHELGHALGLQHSATSTATMYFRGSRGRIFQRTLHADDIAGACFLYPATAFACNEDADCPVLYDWFGGSTGHRRTGCQGGSCVPATTDYGSDCLSNGQCTSGLCQHIPQAPSLDPGACSQGCTIASDNCPNGDLCADPLQTGSTCFPGREDCVVDEDCTGETETCRADIGGAIRCVPRCPTDRGPGDQCGGFLPGDAALLPNEIPPINQGCSCRASSGTAVAFWALWLVPLWARRRARLTAAARR